MEASALLARAERLISQCDDLADGMNMRFLYDADRRLFTIGFNVETRRLDGSYYDLLASEARIASFVAIARGDVPAEHWLALGRIFGGDWWPAGPAFVERHDVRVPHAAAVSCAASRTRCLMRRVGKPS